MSFVEKKFSETKSLLDEKAHDVKDLTKFKANYKQAKTVYVNIKFEK
jgi:hypothetical protein